MKKLLFLGMLAVAGIVGADTNGSAPVIEQVDANAPSVYDTRTRGSAAILYDQETKLPIAAPIVEKYPSTLGDVVDKEPDYPAKECNICHSAI